MDKKQLGRLQDNGTSIMSRSLVHYTQRAAHMLQGHKTLSKINDVKATDVEDQA